MKGRYFMVLRHNNAERLVPVDLIPPGRGGQMATPFSAPSTAGKKPVAVLISDGPVSTFIDDGEGMVPLISNRRGSFPTANPPDGWVEPAGRELDHLAGGLLVEMLDKPREGFYLVAQDSGFAGRPKVLRSAIALPKGTGASINQAGENYMDMVHMGLAGGMGEYTQVEQLLSEDVDSVYIDPGDGQALIRGVSVSSPDERGMRLRFFNVPAGAICGWSISGPDGGNQGEPNWLKSGDVEAHFRIEGNPGTYRVMPFIKTAAETTSLKPIEVKVK
jgi:hypothetical protein